VALARAHDALDVASVGIFRPKLVRESDAVELHTEAHVERRACALILDVDLYRPAAFQRPLPEVAPDRLVANDDRLTPPALIGNRNQNVRRVDQHRHGGDHGGDHDRRDLASREGRRQHGRIVASRGGSS
jgi:hypothetical protein